jgi:hypothetical protein
MATRPVRYELHIRPLMRMIDRDNMAWAFDLWDYDQTRANADGILLRTAADMPPPSHGGPWPAEWVALFQRWKDEGFLRLDLGTVDATGYTAVREGEVVTLTGRGSTPTGGYRAWLHAVVPEGGPREYILYWEPPVPAAPANPTLFRARAKFPAPPTMTSVAVVDAAGRHVVPITTAPPPLEIVRGRERMQPVLEGMGAVRVETVPMAGGSATRYRIGSAQVEVFSYSHGLEVEAAPEMIDRVKRALGGSRPPGPG